MLFQVICRGFAYVKFEVQQDAEDAVRALNNYEHSGNVWHVTWAAGERKSGSYL